MYYFIKPQSASQLGNKTVYDKSVVPWGIEKLHVIFDVWSNDDILKNSPCYFISKKLHNGILDSELSGIEIGEQIQIDKSDTFQSLYPNKKIGEFYLVHITGSPMVSDFGILSPNKLIISEKALKLLNGYIMNDCEIVRHMPPTV